MNIKHIIVVALAALALGLASLGAIAPSASSGQKIVETSATAYVAADTRGEMPGAQHPAAPETVIAGSKPGIASGANGATAGAKPGVAGGGGATVAGSKPGIAGGQGEMHTGASAPRITIDGGLSGRVVAGH